MKKLRVPADKSIAHRAILFSALAEGTSTVRAHLLGRDNLASLRAVSLLGARYKLRVPLELESVVREEELECEVGDEVFLEITGGKLSKPEKVIDCGNSGTTSRLLCGILAAQSFDTTIDGDKSLRKRPFRRVKDPLEQMGASFSDDHLPITIKGGGLRAIRYESPKASAQVKSAVILAGLFASGGKCCVVEPAKSRNHTELMLGSMGANIEVNGNEVCVSPGALGPMEIEVPGDISSAAFLITLALCGEQDVLIENVGLNPTRTGFLDVVSKMGGQFEIRNSRLVGGEEVGDILVKPSTLRGIDISEELFVRSIDEIPAIAVLAAVSEGTTTIRDAAELRVKESDRISMMCLLLSDFGIETSEVEDGFDVKGGRLFLDNEPAGGWEDAHDHRIYMCEAMLRVLSGAPLQRTWQDSIETSFPGFFELLDDLGNSN